MPSVGPSIDCVKAATRHARSRGFTVDEETLTVVFVIVEAVAIIPYSVFH